MSGTKTFGTPVSRLCIAVFALLLPAMPALADPWNEIDAAYAKGDYDTTFRLTLELAKQGDARAQGFVGHLYDAGKGVQKDPVEANRWFKLAADQGDVGAQANLCGSYSYGDGIEEDHAQAFYWCQLSASRGNEFAEYLIGQLYLYGEGVEQDVVDAYKWFLLCRVQARHQSLRDRVAEEMATAEEYLTPEQMDEAKRRAAAWKPVAP